MCVSFSMTWLKYVSSVYLFTSQESWLLQLHIFMFSCEHKYSTFYDYLMHVISNEECNFLVDMGICLSNQIEMLGPFH